MLAHELCGLVAREAISLLLAHGSVVSITAEEELNFSWFSRFSELEADTSAEGF
jgi:hypothetical protein